MSQLAGVISTHAGFAGGTLPYPTYQQVCTKTTGHAEVVRVVYDRRVLDLQQLLQFFFQLHDPGRDRRDRGGQYRSAIFFPPNSLNTRDERMAKAMIAHLADQIGLVSTEVKSEVIFYPADGRHQQYCDVRSITPRPPTGLSNSYWKGFKAANH
ncbi:hypothetical protein CEQ90_18320 [Lewinellaceae bacterium SD302]|nr:hypothetical protein CEQ90_18320 [Lewinellaceae bacterium SD302]